MNTRFLPLILLLSLGLAAGGCSHMAVQTPTAAIDEASSDNRVPGTRDNHSVCLTPEAGGVIVYANDSITVDASNQSEGYLIIRYTGASSKVKLQITGPNGITYTYSPSVNGGADEVYPLNSGDGVYTVNAYENIHQNQYAAIFSQALDVTLRDEMLPYLYPNLYVSFDEDSAAVSLARDLALSADDDLEVISSVYNYIIEHVRYDHEKARSIHSGYLPDIDETLETGTGICLDYAALMTAMLRSQRIPTRVEVGYVGTAYHAWISTFVEEVGWVNGMIKFDGHDWSLMDPTFASTTEADQLKDFIGNGENYILKYVY